MVRTTKRRRRPRTGDVEPLVIKDVATLKAIADPFRIRILLELTGRGCTVKEVASALGSPPTHLYYHFKILERNGLIRVVDRRLVSGIEERTYEAVASSWTTSPEATPTLVESGIVAAMLNVVRAELELALLAQKATVPIGDPTAPVPVLSLTRLALSPSEVEEVQRRLNALIEEFYVDQGPTAGKGLYHAIFAAYRVPAELHRDAGNGLRDGAGIGISPRVAVQRAQ